MAAAIKLLLSFIVLLAYYEAAAKITYDRKHDFGPVKLYWKYHKASGRLYFRAIANALGWVGIGFTTNKGGGDMKYYDIAVCGAINATTNYIHDLWSTAKMKPFLDARQNFNLTMAKEEHGNTTVEFWRKVRTTDLRHDLQFKDKNDVCLVYAFHPTKDAFTYHDLAYHGLKSNRGHMTVCDINILGPPISPTKAPSSSAETRAFLPVILFGFIMGMLLPVSY